MNDTTEQQILSIKRKIKMGIITKCVECIHCNEKFRLRYNLGNKYPQNASFPCHTCGENLTFGFEKEEEEEVILKNIRIIEFRMDLKIINLHPELTLDPMLKDDPNYFPSLDFIMRQNERGLEGLTQFQSAQKCCILYQQKWDAIQKDFRYLTEGRWILLKEKYGDDQPKITQKILLEVFHTADNFLQGKWAELSDNGMAVVGEAYRHPCYAGLHNYLMEFRDDFLMNKLYDAMNTYRDVEEFLLPTLLYQKCGFTPVGLSSTVNWDKIKMVYGTFYEIYGDLLLVPTTLNNLLVRNHFNKFNSDNFNLKKYIDADKSGKAENFKSNSMLTDLSEFYDSSIRNGTHHNASSFNKENQTITIKTGRGGRGHKHISLVSYIEHCNEIYARILIVIKCYHLLNLLKPRF